MKQLFKLAMAAIAYIMILTVTGCNKNNNDDYTTPVGVQPIIAKASGDSTSIIATINQFRSILGDSLNTTPGKTSGRREVNWDGVPANFTNNNSFPPEFFNNTDPAGPNGRKRGLVYLNTGAPLRLDSSNFSELDASYADEFLPFSKKKTIVAVGSTISEVAFKIPGTNTDAAVKGFGIIFSDVDDANSTYLEFFDGAKSLGIFKAPARNAAGGFSFLGVYFTGQKITKVRITSGNAALANGVKDLSDGGSKDLVVYDDFFYNEPQLFQ